MKKIALFVGLSFASTTLSAAITSNFSGGDLDIATDAGDDIVLTIDNGFVKLNGADPDSGPLEAALVTSIDVNGDDGDNNFDFSAVTEANFPNFFSAEFDTEDGNDVLAATDFRDVIDLGEGTDQVTSFGGGFNLMDWGRGDGTESFAFNDPDGVLRLRLQGSTSDDDIQISASGNVVSLTDQSSSETIQIENITDIALQLGDGDDVVTVSDLSSLTTREQILINKNSGSINYGGGSSNYPVALNVSSLNIDVDAAVSPGQDSLFSRQTSFSSTPFVYNITKSGMQSRLSSKASTAPVTWKGSVRSLFQELRRPIPIIFWRTLAHPIWIASN